LLSKHAPKIPKIVIVSKGQGKLGGKANLNQVDVALRFLRELELYPNSWTESGLELIQFWAVTLVCRL